MFKVKPRIASPDRKRNSNLSPLQIDGKWCCLGCHQPVKQDCYGGKLRRPPLRCHECRRVHSLTLDILSGRFLATSAVATARRNGAIGPAKEFPCVDCARPAECYDHRDYGQPLKVEPVCFSCNVVRGHAKPLNPFIVSALLLATGA